MVLRKNFVGSYLLRHDARVSRSADLMMWSLPYAAWTIVSSVSVHNFNRLSCHHYTTTMHCARDCMLTFLCTGAGIADSMEICSKRFCCLLRCNFRVNFGSKYYLSWGAAVNEFRQFLSGSAHNWLQLRQTVPSTAQSPSPQAHARCHWLRI